MDENEKQRAKELVANLEEADRSHVQAVALEGTTKGQADNLRQRLRILLGNLPADQGKHGIVVRGTRWYLNSGYLQTEPAPITL